jgi:FMN phosphatase YigB (HAD superfamily)/ribosomal protein L40E
LTAAAGEDEEELSKWERMYHHRQKQQEEQVFFDADPDYSENTQRSLTSQIRVVSFDLDDTLWRTAATISAANDALSDHIASIEDFKQPQRVEVIMGELFQADKPRYAPIQGENATAPVLLTSLRKDAIAHLATNHNIYTTSDAQSLADECFQIWTQARHDAIPVNMAESVLSCLDALKQLETSTGERILIGAITDGNSNPSLLPDIAQYFDFCVNAEQVGVGKPSRLVYEQAIRQVMERWTSTSSSSPSSNEINELLTSIDPEAPSAGPWWIHVGDDFIKDIVAAKDLGMRTVWSRELVLHKLNKTQPKTLQDPAMKEPTKSLEDFQKEVSEQTVVKMQIGSEDYLVDALEKEFADAATDRFADIEHLVTRWHKEGIEAAQKENEQPTTATTAAADGEAATSEAAFANSPEILSATAAHKFCMSCGQKLPISAIFCPSCGTRQD